MVNNAIKNQDQVNSDKAQELSRTYEKLESKDILKEVILKEFKNAITVVSSFGAESVVLLHLVVDIAPKVPVLFLNTGKHFGETMRYKDNLQNRLGLGDIRSLAPTPNDIKNYDPDGILATKDPDECCRIRKVDPLNHGLSGFDAWITGRKRFQSTTRKNLNIVEWKDGRFKINPIADWDQSRIDNYIVEHSLPRHPLVRDGYLSIGCMPCTDRVAIGDDSRSGRWGGLSKSECGIHD